MLIGWASTGWCPSTGWVCWAWKTSIRLLGVMLTWHMLCSHCLGRRICHLFLWVWCGQAVWLLGPVILLGILIPNRICW